MQILKQNKQKNETTKPTNSSRKITHNSTISKDKYRKTKFWHWSSESNRIEKSALYLERHKGENNQTTHNEYESELLFTLTLN